MKEGKVLFWSQVLEVLAGGHLGLLLVSCGEMGYYGKEDMGEPRDTETGRAWGHRDTETERAGDRVSPFAASHLPLVNDLIFPGRPHSSVS